MSTSEVEAALRLAIQRRDRAMQALRPKHKGGEVEEFRSAEAAVMQAERDLAAAKGEEYAVPIDFPVQWCSGAPLPHLIQNDSKTFLVFLLRLPVDDYSSGNPEVAIAEVVHCSCTKMGTPNDEVWAGHPLSGKGYEGHGAQEVKNSKWIKELEAILSVHWNYQPGWSERLQLRHYIFPFHDSIFECVAQSFKVEVFDGSLSDALAECCRRLAANL
jgi:hypothetical protein